MVLVPNSREPVALPKAEPSPSTSPQAHFRPKFHMTSYSEPNLSSTYRNHTAGNEDSACSQGLQQSDLSAHFPQRGLVIRNPDNGDKYHHTQTAQAPSVCPFNPTIPQHANKVVLKTPFHHSAKSTQIHDRGITEAIGLDLTSGPEKPDFTAYDAANDSRAGACLVAWPSSDDHCPQTTSMPTPAPQDWRAELLGKSTGRGADHDREQRQGERREGLKTASYSALEAALDARRGACFVAWPMDEEWKIPTLCV